MDIRTRRTHYFERQARSLRAALAAEVDDDHLDAIASDAAAAFARMVDEIPYADHPDHVMAESILSCYGVLAFYAALRTRGYSTHVLGRATLTSLKTYLDGTPAATSSAEAAFENREDMQRQANESQRRAAPEEFVFEMLEGDEESDYGINILSCAICHAYDKHDAMDLVPYMCASDDVISDARGQGLRRSGTIALGAHHCDFRFEKHGSPRRLVEQYPERIRLKEL